LVNLALALATVVACLLMLFTPGAGAVTLRGKLRSITRNVAGKQVRLRVVLSGKAWRAVQRVLRRGKKVDRQGDGRGHGPQRATLGRQPARSG
jgi:hypothetical protein